MTARYKDIHNLRYSEEVMRPIVILVAILYAGIAQAQGTPGEFDEIGDGAGQSEAGLQPYLEYKKRVETAQSISPLDNGMFGESTRLYNGSTAFSVVDIDLPGNSSLPVQLARLLTIDIQPQPVGPAYDTLLRGIGNWDVDLPHMSATYPDSTGWYTNRCSGGSVPPLLVGAGAFRRADYWNGISVHIPGRGTTTAMGVAAAAPKPTNGAGFRLTTTERDYFDCIPMQSGLSGEGFRMTTSGGLKYYFNVGVSRTASRLEGEVVYWDTLRAKLVTATVYLPRKKYFLLASKIEDPLGNSVHFDYNAAGHPTRIWSSDGRNIDFTYANGRLVTATADGRVWRYEYTPNAHADPNPDLARVMLPDESQWQYSYAGTLKPGTPPPYESLSLPWCRGTAAGVEQEFSVVATHPSGAVGQFAFQNMRHYRSGVHATECLNLGGQDFVSFALLVPYYFDVMSLTRKVISGPGVPEKIWDYDYGSTPEMLWGSTDESPVYPCTNCTTEKLVTITKPDGSLRRYRFGMMYRFNDARELGSEVVEASGAVLRAEVNQYLSEAEAPNQLFHGSYGSVLGGISDPMGAFVRPIVSKVITQQGRAFVWRVDSTCGPNGSAYCFDHLARPVRVVKVTTQP